MAAKAKGVTITGNYEQGKNVMVSLDKTCENFIGIIAADTESSRLENLFDALINFRTELMNARAIKGLNKYAKDQEDDATYDARAEWKKVIDNTKAASDWLADNMVIRANPNKRGEKNYNSYTVAELAPLVALLQAVRDEIE